jgi:hypothetical protein
MGSLQFKEHGVKRSKVLVLAFLALLGLEGCAGLNRPQIAHPGPAPYQQRVAERFNAMPEPNIAPEVVGARPRESQQALPEPARARWPVPGVRP